MAMAGKRLTALEMPDEDQSVSVPPVAAVEPPLPAAKVLTDVEVDYQAPGSIPLPPIPPAPVRRVMVQLSIKAPVDLVDRLESMATATRAQKQAIIAAALDAYMRGHGY